MDEHIIEVFVPHRKLRKLYYLISALLLVLWLPDLNKYNIPLPTKVLEPWFLDKLLLTTVALLLLYSFSTYYLVHVHNKSSPETTEHPTTQIDETKVKILKLLYEQNEISTFNFENLLSYQHQTAKYHLGELEKAKMIVNFWPNSIETWRITQPGRKYLHDTGEVA